MCHHPFLPPRQQRQRQQRCGVGACQWRFARHQSATAAPRPHPESRPGSAPPALGWRCEPQSRCCCCWSAHGWAALACRWRSRCGPAAGVMQTAMRAWRHLPRHRHLHPIQQRLAWPRACRWRWRCSQRHSHRCCSPARRHPLSWGRRQSGSPADGARDGRCVHKGLPPPSVRRQYEGTE